MSRQRRDPESTNELVFGVYFEMAVMQHEILTSYMKAGFTRAEAMQVVLTIIKDGLGAGRQQTKEEE
jgi:hypothetical protein